MEFVTAVHHRLRQLRDQIQRRGQEEELILEIRTIEKLIEAENSRLTAAGAWLPTKAVTDLDIYRFRALFRIESAPRYESEFIVPREERLPLPKYLGKYPISEFDISLISNRVHPERLPSGYRGVAKK